MFAERGFAATSMSLLARETGVTQSLIHHHFGSKRGLWNRLKERYGEEYLRRAGPLEVAGDDPIASWAEHFFRFLEANPELVRLIAWAGLDADDELPDRMLEVTRSVDALFREQQLRGRIRADVDPVHAHVLISLCVTGWLQSRPIACALSGLDPDEPGLDERFLSDLVSIFKAGLAPEAERSTRPPAVADTTRQPAAGASGPAGSLEGPSTEIGATGTRRQDQKKSENG